MSDNIFSKSLSFQVKNKDLEDRLTPLNVSIDLHTSPAPIQKKFLNIQLTDATDSFFLYTLKLDEEDFQTLKVNQGLLVDFPSFPQKLTGLLNLCLEEEKKEVPKFVLQLIHNERNATVNIVETNPFKHLIHLSLNVVPGNDEAVKTFLAECLREYKERNERLVNELRSTETSLGSSLRATEEALTSRTSELSALKLQWENKLSEIQAKNAHNVNHEKELSLKAQSSTQQRFLQEKKDLEQAHMKIVKQFEARVYELDTQNKELTEAKFVNDASIRDLTSKLAQAEEEGKKMRMDVQQLRKDNSDLESELHRQEKSANQLVLRVAVLEQQLNDKESAIGSSKDLLESEKAQKQLLEGELAKSKSRLTHMETSTKTLSDEIIKANEIIRKLQQESKTVHSKLKVRSQIALKQEEVLKGKEKDVDRLENELGQLRETNTRASNEMRDMKEKMESMKEQQADYEKKIASNENVISWLNKQLDQVQIGRTRIGSAIPTHTVSITNSRTVSNIQPSDTTKEQTTPHPTSKLPQPKFKSTPIADNEESKENEPVIDAKYLPAVSGPAPAPLKPRNWMTTGTDALLPPGKTRISKEHVNPHNALATAYFPQRK